MALFDTIRARRLLERERLSLELLETKQYREALTTYGTKRLKRSLDDSDEDDWIDLSGYGSRELSEDESQSLREQAAKLYYKNGHARGVIRLFEKYVVGRGFTVMPKDDVEQVRDYWREFWRVNKMERRKKEIVRRGMRDGEVFIRKFRDNGMLVLRFMNPAKVKTPDTVRAENAKHGIKTDPDDIEKVVSYYYKGDEIPADEVIHEKILVDSDVKRGRSFLEILAKYMVMYNKWLTDRMKLNYIRSLIGMHRKVQGTSAKAATLAAGYETTKLTAPDGTGYHRTPEGVSVITTNPGVDYEFKTPNLQASDVQHDGRAILLALSAASGLPEYMVTGDASNANFACESEDTEVLTVSGWKGVGELSLEDEVATVNRETLRIEYQKPKTIHVYEHSGKMVRIKGSHNLDMLVTENHRMWVWKRQYRRRAGKLIREGFKVGEFVEAGRLRGTSYVLPSAQHDGVAVDVVTIPGIERSHLKAKEERSCDAFVFAEFLGYFVSEGWLLDNGSHRWVIGLRQNKGVVEQEMQRCLDKMPVNWQRLERNDGTVTWQVFDKALWHWLKEQVGAGAINKHLPSFVKSWEPALLNVLLEALIDGDGNRRGKSAGYYTMSKRLADDVMEIAIKAGYTCHIRRQMKSGVYPLAIKRTRLIAINAARHVSRVDYDGLVWSPEVPNETFVARRNGIMHIHGNSTLVAEAPGVMEFEDWQDFWGETFKTIYRAAIQTGIDAGQIPERVVRTEMVDEVDPVTGEVRQVEKPVTVEIEGDCDVVFPEVIHRDLLKETQALVLQYGQEWVSAHTAAARLDLDYEEETEKIEQEARRRGEKVPEAPADLGYNKARDEQLAAVENPGETGAPEKTAKA